MAIWDRLFGTYVAEDPAEPPMFGIVEPLYTFNPLKATFHEWASLCVDLVRVRGWRNKLAAVFAPPAWATAYHAMHAGGNQSFSERDRIQHNNPAAQ